MIFIVQFTSLHHIIKFGVINFSRPVRIRLADELCNIDGESKILRNETWHYWKLAQLRLHTFITAISLSVDISPVLSGCPPKAMNASSVSVSSLAFAAVVFWFSMTLRNSANSISPLLSSSTCEIIWKISSSVGFCPMAFSVAFNSGASICEAEKQEKGRARYSVTKWRGTQRMNYDFKKAPSNTVPLPSLSNLLNASLHPLISSWDRGIATYFFDWIRFQCYVRSLLSRENRIALETGWVMMQQRTTLAESYLRRYLRNLRFVKWS